MIYMIQLSYKFVDTIFFVKFDLYPLMNEFSEALL